MLTWDVEQYLVPRRKELGIEDKPMWFDETAMGRPLPGEWTMAREMPKRAPYLWAYGTDAWYNFCIFIDEKSSSGFGYSMLRLNYEPTPNLPSFTALVRVLRGRAFDETLESSASLDSFAFKAEGAFTGVDDASGVLIVWKEDVNLPDFTHAVCLRDATSTMVLDLMGTANPLDLRDVRGAWHRLRPRLDPDGGLFGWFDAICDWHLPVVYWRAATGDATPDVFDDSAREQPAATARHAGRTGSLFSNATWTEDASSSSPRTSPMSRATLRWTAWTSR